MRAGRLFLVVAVCAAGRAAITNVRVMGATSTQAILQYTAPDAASCTVEVSENSSYSPLAADVDSSLFSGANSDGGGGRSRVFIAGKKKTDTALNGKVYSRALQQFTTHYFRITCGADTATGTLRTSNIPFGNNHAELMPVISAGSYGFPTLGWNRDTDRAQQFPDPNTGALIRRVTMISDVTSDLTASAFTTTGLGTNWTSPANVLANDGLSASYAGTTQDWLAITVGGSGISLFDTMSVDWVRVKVRGNSATGTGDESVLQMCLTTDGASCKTDIKEILLGTVADTEHCYPNGGSPTSCANTIIPIDTWVDPPLIREHVNLNPNFGVLARKKGSAAGTITAQYVSYQMGRSKVDAGFETGAFTICSNVAASDSAGNVGYHCYVFSSPGGHLFWINRATGEARFLGLLRISGSGIATNQHVNTSSATWDATQAGTLYEIDNDTSSPAQKIVIKGVFTGGNDASVASGAIAAVTWTSLTPAPNHLNQLITNFTSGYATPFAPADFTCAAAAVQNNHVFARCLRGGQDSYAWKAVYRVGDRQPVGSCSGCGIVAAHATWNIDQTRWCGHHSTNPAGDVDVWDMISSHLDTNSTGQGIFKVTLNGCSGTGCNAGTGDLTACTEPCQTTLSVTSTWDTANWGAAPAGWTAGEPVNVNLDHFLQTTAAGDIFIMGSERLRIVTKNSATSWLVDRGWGNSTTAAHTNGATMQARCKDKGLSVSGIPFWQYLGSPDATNPAFYVVDDGPVYSSHHAHHGSWRIGATAWSTCGGGLPSNALCSGADAYTIKDSPTFAGGVASLAGNAWEKHPTSALQVAARAEERVLGWDIPAFKTSSALGPTGITNVSGSLWKFTNSNLERKLFETVAFCGVRPLVDVSSAATGDVMGTGAEDHYKYCIAQRAGECRAGSAAGEIFANCPGLSGTPICKSGAIGKLDENEICLGDLPAYGSGVAQIRMDRNDSAGRNVRMLATNMTRLHTGSLVMNAKPLPDGSWFYFTANLRERDDGFLAKVPPRPPEDSVNRGEFLSVPVSIKPPPGLGVNNAVVEFGYNSNLYCTSRAEVCVKGSQSEGDYGFAGDPVTGAGCSSGCTINVPAISQRVLYYRWVYRDATNVTLARSQIHSMAAP